GDRLPGAAASRSPAAHPPRPPPGADPPAAPVHADGPLPDVPRRRVPNRHRARARTSPGIGPRERTPVRLRRVHRTPVRRRRRRPPPRPPAPPAPPTTEATAAPRPSPPATTDHGPLTTDTLMSDLIDLAFARQHIPTATDSDEPTISTIISAASRAVQRYCD